MHPDIKPQFSSDMPLEFATSIRSAEVREIPGFSLVSQLSLEVSVSEDEGAEGFAAPLLSGLESVT